MHKVQYNLKMFSNPFVCTPAGIDYQPLIQNITLSQLVASVLIQVDIIENNITDGNRRFGLRIVIPKETKQLGIELGTLSELLITIIDDDGNVLMHNCSRL